MHKIIAAVAAASIATTAAADDWITTWYASPQPTWGAEFALPTNVPAVLEGQTVREVVRTSAGGTRLRVSFSNRYGSEPLIIGEARIARTVPNTAANTPASGQPASGAAAGADSTPAAVATAARASMAATGGATSAVDVGSTAVLTFGGHRSVTIAPGQTATSDALDFVLPPLQRLTISTWLPQRAPTTTFHWGTWQTGYIASGNATAAANLDGAQLLQGRAFLSAVEVAGGDTRQHRTVVAFGDSLTDGNGSTPDQNRRWPDYLAGRLAQQGIGVANAGIAGARLLGDKMGVKAADRFQHDVLDQPGVGTVVVLMGINDIGWPGSAFAPQDAPATAEQLIAAYRQLIARAHAANVRIIGATLPPYEGSLQGTPFEGHHTPAKDAVRRQVNEWIRHSGAFDTVADFDAALRDPAHSTRLLPAYDCGDHLHPSDAGYAAMAEVVQKVL
ncbi:SGNH/GDSL hydrolase family protein [Pseudoduganella sp. RAF19]|uniref:SGNH/GDSL hydrolase family protein n=1 Tax=Pseudoduganella sp. RAF19 TaxID=3233052 RepID=UPI003F9E7AC6